MRTIRFPFALASGAATVTATLDANSYEVQEATDPQGQTLLVTPDDLDAIEAYLDARPFVVTRSYEVAETHALDVMTGETARFTICHDRGEVLAVHYNDGRLAAPQHEQFTEVAETFALDRRYEEEEDGFHDCFAKF